MPFLADRLCEACGHKYEEALVNREAHYEPQACPSCGSYQTVMRVGCKADPITIVRGNADFAERQHARLTARSNDHWKRKGAEEAMDREATVMGKEGYVRR